MQYQNYGDLKTEVLEDGSIQLYIVGENAGQEAEGNEKRQNFIFS